MKHRNTTNRTFRTAGATMIALLAISTAACGGSTTIDSAANDTTVEAEAPAADTADESASVDQAEQTSDTNDSTSTQGSTSGSSSSGSSSSNSSSSNSGSSNSGSSSSGSVQSQSDQTATEEPAAEEPAAEEPAAEEPMAEEEPAAEEPAAEEPAAEEPMAEEEPAAEEPAPIAQSISAEFAFTNPLDVQVSAELLGSQSANAKGIASVCMIQYNEYGNPIYRNGDPYRRNVPSVEVNGVRYPAVLLEGCAPSIGNLGVYTKTWSVTGQTGVNGSVKPYLDIAIRAEDGQVKLFCIDTTVRNAQFVERNVADFANRTSMGACRY